MLSFETNTSCYYLGLQPLVGNPAGMSSGKLSAI
jgi:hypothetical protein